MLHSLQNTSKSKSKVPNLVSWGKLIVKILPLLVVKSSFSSQAQRQKVMVVLQAPPYSKQGGITRFLEATRSATGQALIYTHPPHPHFHPPLMSKDPQESRGWVSNKIPLTSSFIFSCMNTLIIIWLELIITWDRICCSTIFLCH